MLVSIGFTLGGVVSLRLALFLYWFAMQAEPDRLKLIGAGTIVLLLVPCFILASRFFYKEYRLHPIRQYLKNPAGFEIIQGKIVKCHYSYTGNGRGRMFAEIKAKNEETLIETFHPSIWPFTTQEAEDSLQEGDDWYDMKGKRRLLPVPVFLLCHKDFASALMGIDRQYLSKP